MLKIRLRRMGAIRQPSYRIVVADARSPRDGRFVEIIGHYNPLTDPATIDIDLEKFEDWKKKGAQPTDAVASLARQYAKRQRQQVEVNPQTRAATKKGVVAPPQEAKAEVAAEATAEEPVVTPSPEEAQPEAAAAEAETPNAEANPETGA